MSEEILMTALNQGQSRIICISGPADEFNQEIRQWLINAGNNICASPDIYDTLALLSRGQKPSAIIIDMTAVDWNEMSFFDLAKRLSPETDIYVSGSQHQQDKIQAACIRGAAHFDQKISTVDLSRKTTTSTPIRVP